MELSPKISQATLAYLAAFWRLIHRGKQKVSQLFVMCFHQSDVSFLIEYTSFFSKGVVDTFNLYLFAPLEELEVDYIDMLIKTEGSGITRGQFPLEVRKDPLKWSKVYANCFYSPLNRESLHLMAASDFTTELSLASSLVEYQCFCSHILEDEQIALATLNNWENDLYPTNSTNYYLKTYALLLEEVELIKNELLIPVPLSLTSFEWTKTDGIVPPGPDPIKVIVLNKYLVMFLVLEMGCSPALILALMKAGAFEFTRKNKPRTGDGWKILETVLSKIAENRN